MMQWIVSSSVLILVVIALRYVLRGKLSLRMQYALWLLVLVRLLSMERDVPALLKKDEKAP